MVSCMICRWSTPRNATSRISRSRLDSDDAKGTESLLTLRWREMDSSFQYASTVRWHPATDLPLPPTVKRRSAGRPPPMARPRSEAQRGSERPAAAMRSTHREMRCSAAVQAARYRVARRAAMRRGFLEAIEIAQQVGPFNGRAAALAQVGQLLLQHQGEVRAKHMVADGGI
jgi:hypothetical protein